MSLKPFNFVRLLIMLVSLSLAIPAFSQSTQNLSNVRVDELTDAQILNYQSQVEAMGLTEDQLEQVALSRGMSATEVQKLKDRIEKLKASGKISTTGKNNMFGTSKSQQQRAGRKYNFELGAGDSTEVERDTLSPQEKALQELRSRIFGANLFKNKQLTFEPNLRLATPRNYQIGPDDKLLIDIYGYSEASYELTVSPEGTVNVPYVGVIRVGGMTVEQATAKLKSRLSTIYTGLRAGNTHLSIAIGDIRSIKVVLTGEVVKPGTYTLPSLATVFNALYYSGGPTENGSFRKIELIRGGRRIATLDLYDFLVHGEFKNNVRLQDQDVIRIPPYQKRVEIVGEVKHPAIFEMLEGETVRDLLRFAGDFNERAYKARIKVLRNTDTERKISDVTSDDFGTYHPANGDKYFVDQILDRFENRVSIEGAVFRPGQFELESGLTVKQLIQKAEGLREDAFQNRAYITRLKSDLQTELISFDLAKVLSGESADIPLQREDIVTVSSIFDLKEQYNVRVDGEVRAPGSLRYAEGMTLEDAIIQAGGLKEGATGQRVEISRRIRNSDALNASAQTAQVFQVNIDRSLKESASKFILQPFDIVVVRPASGYQVQRLVRIEGEVLYPGIYSLSKKDERVSDLIKRAGGFTALAFPDGASLKRMGPPKQDSVSNMITENPYGPTIYQSGTMRSASGNGFGKPGLGAGPGGASPSDQLLPYYGNGNGGVRGGALSEEERIRQFQRLQRTISDTLSTNEVEAIKNNYVGINLPRILKKPGGKDDIFLEEGDILTIPKQLQTVKVSGQVLSPVTVVFSSNKGFKQYISNAGGFAERARKKSAYIIYANGSVKSAKKFLFFNNYPDVKPGSEIFVPKKAEGRKLQPGEIVGITSGLTSLMAIIVALFNK